MFTGGLTPQNQRPQGTNQNQQSSFDRLVTITGYDIPNKFMYATDEAGQKYEIFINKDSFDRADKAVRSKAGFDAAKINWMGHSIDAKMEKSLKPGNKVILLQSKTTKNDKVRGLKVVEVNRIGGVPQQEADKTFQGLFTMTYRRSEGIEVLARVQHWNWNEQSNVDINDSEAVEALKAKIDDARKSQGTKIGDQKVSEPTIGVQFRALMKTDRVYSVDNSPIWEAVDFSIPFDWIPAPEDEEGKQIQGQGHSLTGEEMEAFAGAYVDYIMENEMFKDHIDNMKIEICSYKVYPVSQGTIELTTGDPERDKKADRNPLWQLSHRESYCDISNSPEGLMVGRNAAVNGIIQISGNKAIKVDGKLVEVPVNWVQKLHANNIKGHVHAFIRTTEGDKVEPHEKLKLIRSPNAPEATNNNYSSQSSAPAQSSQPVRQAEPVHTSTQPETQEFGSELEHDIFSEGDIFGNAGTDLFAPETEVAQETPASAPPAKKLAFGKKA